MEFKYLVDSFADIKVIRYKVPGFEELSLKEKAYLYHLSEAALYGRDILWDQNCQDNLLVRHTLEKIIKNYKSRDNYIFPDNAEFNDFLIYAKRVFFSNGIHHHYAEDKIIPNCSRTYFSSLIESTLIADKAKNIGEQTNNLISIIYEPNIWPKRRASIAHQDSDIVQDSAVTFYKNLTKKEIENYYKIRSQNDKTHQLSLGLNSRLVKKNGEIKEIKYKISGLYSNPLIKICEELEKAKKFAQNNNQINILNKLSEFYRTGDLKTWNDYNIAWVKDTDSKCDFVNGFIENYNDPLGLKSSWESVVNFKNIKASKRTSIIQENAQWFEDHSPVNKRFKKSVIKGVSAKVITMVQLGGDCYPYTPIGINLPNADWIRKDYGSKSVTIENICDAYDKSALESPKSILSEFSWNKEIIKRANKYGTLTNNLHTDLHECLGHGSGKLLENTDPNALAEYASTLEETRADLFALYYMADPYLVKLGLLPDSEAYKCSYDKYILNGIFTQFTRVQLGKKNTQAHMQNRKLIAEYCFSNGGNIIEKRIRENKTYFIVNDYEGLRRLFAKLLIEVQRIKSEGDYLSGKNLVETYAINIDQKLHKEVLERYKKLNLQAYSGFVNPVIRPIKKDGKIINYIISYTEGYLNQMLRYSKEYSTL
ncbi:MAG: dihydrofolate reductase [Bacteroidales bacterium]